jgi:competence protein ComEA
MATVEQTASSRRDRGPDTALGPLQDLGRGGNDAAPTLEVDPASGSVPRAPANPWVAVALRAGAGFVLLSALATVGMVSAARGSSSTLQGSKASTESAAWIAPAHALEREPSGQGPSKREGHSVDADAAADDGGSRGITSDGKVVLNVADAEELRRLPGVGVRRADAIIQLRKRLKRFRRVSDLLRVRGIGVRALRKIQPRVVLDPPPSRDARELDGGAG